MNFRLKISFLSAIAVFALAAALPAKIIGSGNVTTDNTHKVSGFHGIELTASGGVVLTQGETEGLVVEGEDNILPLVEASVTDKGVLRLGFKSHEEVYLTKPLVFRVAAKTVDSLVVAGSGDVHSKSLSVERFTVKVSGSGDVVVDHLETGAVAVAIQGSGNVKLAGKASDQTVEMSGSGDYDAADLKTSAATVNVSGSGDCDLAVSDKLVANVSGSGDVTYSGRPAVTKSVSGSGSVEASQPGK